MISSRFTRPKLNGSYSALAYCNYRVTAIACMSLTHATFMFVVSCVKIDLDTLLPLPKKNITPGRLLIPPSATACCTEVAIDRKS